MWMLFSLPFLHFSLATEGNIAPLIRNQNYIKSDDRFDDFKLPQDVHGLYLLGKFSEDCVFISVSAYGKTNNVSQSHTGFLLFYVIERIRNGNGLRVRYRFDVKTPDAEVNERYKLKHVKRKSFQNKDHPKKGDYLAVFIPEKEVLYRGNSTFYPLGIVVKKNTSNSYQVWRNNININYPTSNLTTLLDKVENSIEHGSWSDSWENANKTEELNLNLKIIPLSGPQDNKHTKRNYIAGIVVVVVIVALLVVIIIILVLSRWRPRGRKASRTDKDMLLDPEDEKHIDQNASFKGVGYVLQKDGNIIGKGKTVINVHYHNPKEDSSTKLHQGHEYSLLTEASPPPKPSPCHAAVMASLEDHEDHDYDEPYFEPACMEEELLSQLRRLGVPAIKERSIELLTGELLGSGAFGSVYKGYLSSGQGGSEEVMKEEVAVKTMEEGDRVKFLQEAAIMGQFRHPNIIKILGVVIDQQHCKIIVDVMANGDLRRYLHTLKTRNLGSKLPPTLLSCSRHVANGMMYLEVKSFIHRDLAARNVLVAEDGVCKIADFGLSRELQREDFYLSHGGKIPVKWTAPEALHYHKYSTASDVWSYGCVLYEIWSLGEKPYYNLTNEQVIEKLLAGFRLSPPTGCPRDVYQIMIRCWNPEPLKRPSFMDITTLLQKPDFQVLKWSAEDLKAFSEAARTLGAPLDAGCQLYKDLQNSYVTAD